MKSLSIFALGLVNVTLGSENMSSFMEYVSKHGKTYKTVEEFEMRFSLYNKVDAQIRAHQERNDVSH